MRKAARIFWVSYALGILLVILYALIVYVL